MDKKKRRISLAILLLVLGVFAYNSRKGQPNLGMPSLPAESLKDAVANNAAHIPASSDLALPSSEETNLKDSVAESPALETGRGFQGNGNPNPGTPRGGTDGGFIGGANNPGSQFGGSNNNAPSTVSPSGPTQPQ